MKKINLLLLMTFVCLVPSCSNPSLHKPRFSDYGRSVSSEELTISLNRKIDELRENYLSYGFASSYQSSSSRTLKKGVTVNSISSSINNMDGVLTYSQNEEIESYDPLTLRFNKKTTYKAVVLENNKRKRDFISQKIYGEVIGEKFILANSTLQTYETYSSVNGYSVFHERATYLLTFSSFFQERYWYSTSKITCYINNNTFTIVAESDESNNYTINALYQLTFGSTYVDYKQKIDYRYLNVNRSRTIYYDYSLGKIKESISKINYDNYAVKDV